MAPVYWLYYCDLKLQVLVAFYVDVNWERAGPVAEVSVHVIVCWTK